jgi:hypothetical protein
MSIDWRKVAKIIGVVVLVLVLAYAVLLLGLSHTSAHSR